MKKSGFILIELLVSMVIAAMMATVLFASIFQLVRSQKAAVDISSYDTRLLLFSKQVAADVQGFFVPVQAEIKKPFAVKSAQNNNDEPLKKLKPLKQIFYAAKQKNNEFMFSWISTNAMQSYWDDRAGRAKPHVARVIYKLVPDPTRKQLFSLTRQEGYILNLRAYESNEKQPLISRPHELLDNIESMEVSFQWHEQPEQSESDEQKKSTSPQLQEAAVWDTQQNKTDAPMQRIAPDYIKIALTLWNETFTQTRSYSFLYAVPGNKFIAQEAPPPPPDQEKLQEATPKTPPASQEKRASVEIRKKETHIASAPGNLQSRLSDQRRRMNA